jgi:hypothetical protein|nr:MAG TPA_asm: PLAT/LH2 and C2-like Ca2+-binding lipoprotein [Caudoviricetes sp.]
MRTLLMLCLVALITGCSGKEDDYSNKSEQELWLNGYTTTSSSVHADKESNIIRFLFFKAGEVTNFDGKSFDTGFDSYYEYTQLTEDAIYTKLIDEGKLLLKDGSIISPLLDIQTSPKKTKEVVLPVGKYFVVAFYYDRGYRRDFWNKYATKFYELESRYNPQALTVVIPVDYTKYGCINWRNWED